MEGSVSVSSMSGAGAVSSAVVVEEVSGSAVLSGASTDGAVRWTEGVAAVGSSGGGDSGGAGCRRVKAREMATVSASVGDGWENAKDTTQKYTAIQTCNYLFPWVGPTSPPDPLCGNNNRRDEEHAYPAPTPAPAGSS